MRWQKAARGVVAMAGVGTAVAVYVLTRPRPVDNRPPVFPAADPTATVQSGAGTYLRQDGSRLIGRVDYEGLRDYADGRIDYKNATFTLEDGTTMSADLVEGKGKAAKGDQPSELKLTGHARLHTADGTLLQGDEGAYSDVTGIATIPGAAAFTHGRMSGTGTGGTYERGTGVFKLLADTKISMTPEGAADTPIEATSQSMTFVRAAKSMLFDDQAHIARSAETLTADHATLYLTDDEQRFKAMELRGNSKVTPAPGKASALPDMQANDIDLGFYPDGQALQRAVLSGSATMIQTNDQGRRSIESSRVTFATAPDGKTLTRLEAPEHVVVKTPASAGEPERTITAASLVATGDDKAGLTKAVFDGGVEFVEHVPSTGGRAESRRVGTSQTLTLALKGQLDAIDEADFQRDTKFRDGEVLGDADLGLYHASSGQLELLPLAKSPRRPRVTNGTVAVDAAEIIIVDLDTQNLHARRDVKTASIGGSGGTTDNGIFNAHDTLYGYGAEFWYTAANKSVHYASAAGASAAPAKLTQGESVVIAADIQFFQDTQNLSAKGRVDSTFRLVTGTSPADAKSPQKYGVKADSFVYDDGLRTAKYTGAPAVSMIPQGKIDANVLVFTLAKEGRALDRLDASTNVHTLLQSGREAQGEGLLYDVAKDLYTLRGQPLTLLTKDTEGTCSLLTATLARFPSGTGAPDVQAADNPGGAQTRAKQPCVLPRPASGLGR